MVTYNINLEGKTVLVTGAAGFIGSNLVKRLFHDVKNIRVVGIDSMTDYYDVNIKHERLKEIEALVNANVDANVNHSWRFVKATLADKAEGLTWDMIQVVTEYPTNIAQGVLYIKVFDEFHNNGWEIIGFKYRGKDGLINTIELSLYRIRYTNRALTEDFLEHRRIWATPSPERTLSNIKGEIEQINVAESDTTVEELAQREAKFFKQEDLL